MQLSLGWREPCQPSFAEPLRKQLDWKAVRLLNAAVTTEMPSNWLGFVVTELVADRPWPRVID